MYIFFIEFLLIVSRWCLYKSVWFFFNGENKIIDEFLENMKFRFYDKEIYIFI